MGHHANQLLVGGPLELPQLLGELLDQQEAAREAAIDERAVVALHAPRAEQPDHARLAGLERGERIAERRVQRVEAAADHRRAGPVEQPLGGGVEAG